MDRKEWEADFYGVGLAGYPLSKRGTFYTFLPMFAHHFNKLIKDEKEIQCNGDVFS